jgi:pyruvate dehydrogenase E1 component
VLRLLADVPDDELADLVHNLGGHDLAVLLDAYRACDAVTDRPSVVFAYTVKGWGLPMAGDPLNHAALLTGEQVDALRSSLGLDRATEWDRFPDDSPEGARCRTVGGELNNRPPAPRPVVPVPESAGGPPTTRAVSTQETFGRLLGRLADHPGVADRLVTTSPDVSVSTNLGGWINKMGVFDPDVQPDYLGEGRVLRWQQAPAGHHVELGISEMNLFLLLHALGLGHELHDEHLLPVGTVYDPFVCRGLDALVYALYNGARFVVVGTPAGVTLAPEGGAHQSSITPSIGLELPGVTYCEPAYATALDWLLCDALAALHRPDGCATYLRLSTRPIDQTPFVDVASRLGTDELRRCVVAGGYRLVEPEGPTDVVLAGCGPVLPEIVAAAAQLRDEGITALVLDLTSPDRLFHGWRRRLREAGRAATASTEEHHLATLLVGHERRVPLVTVHDASSHHLAWIGSVFGAPTVPVGVDEFGQSGRIADLYRHFDLLPEQIVNAALVALA